LRISRRAADKPRIELIPMIDTMAFLLVFFMIASLAMSQQLGIPVSLPRAEAAAPQTWGDRALVVTMDRKGSLFVNKTPVSLGRLKETVRAKLAERPELVVVINADEGLRHGAVIRVMDVVKQAGARQMAIATVAPEGRSDRLR
jgi:biopolymer transport protein ExbD